MASGPAGAASAGPGQVVFVSPAGGAAVSSPVEIAYLHTPACEVEDLFLGGFIGQNMLPPVVFNTATGKNEMEIAPGLGRRVVGSAAEVGLDSVFVTAFEYGGGSPKPRQGVQRAERIVMGLPDGPYEVRFTQFAFCAGNSDLLRFTVGAGGGGGTPGPGGPTPGEIVACEQDYDRQIADQDRAIAALRAGPQTADAKVEIAARESFSRKLERDRGRCEIILADSTPPREQAKIALEELAASSGETAKALLEKAVGCLVPSPGNLLGTSLTKKLFGLWDKVCIAMTGGLGGAAAIVKVGADAGAEALGGGATGNERRRSSHGIPAVRSSALLDARSAGALRRLIAAETAVARLTARLRAAGGGAPAAVPRQLAAKLRSMPGLRAAARVGLARAQRRLPPALLALRYRPDRTRLAALRKDLRARLSALGAKRAEVTAALRPLRPRARARVDLVSLLPPTRRRDAADRIAADALDTLATSLGGGT